MSNQRKKMDQALKVIVIPFLREKGFKGSLPHLRRENARSIDLISFQFSVYGGQFCIELGKYSTKGLKLYNGEIIAPEKVQNSHLSLNRPRLSPTMKNDYWFVFEDKTLDENIYAKLANEVVSLLENQAEAWWANRKNLDPNSL